jgi:UDP-N-acetylmuramoyl-L-alanyl-D-glutamate--2,6-diaminopimelate ligase
LHPGAIRAGLAAFAGVPGRFEIVAREPLLVVDFAHTPDALRSALESGRELARARGGRLGCVFGCGGERDRGKRAPMGELADRLADAVWLTTDNPRAEDPAAIAAMVRAGAQGRAQWWQLPDRGQAIEAAVGWARDWDAVIVAGRGCERIQHFASGEVAFSDREAVLAALHKRTPGAL